MEEKDLPKIKSKIVDDKIKNLAFNYNKVQKKELKSIFWDLIETGMQIAKDIKSK